MLREEGIRAGLFRPQTVWPFPVGALLPLLDARAADRRRRGERRAARGRAPARALPRRRGRRRVHLARAAARRGPAVAGGDRRRGPRRARGEGGGGVSVFYERFERHDQAAGLKAHSTHYCAGCGHGLIHRYLADAIEKLGIQDRTVAVSPGRLRRVPLLLPGRRQHVRGPRARLRRRDRPEAREPGGGRVRLPGRRRPRRDRAARGALRRAARHPDRRHLREQRRLRHDRRAARPDDAHGPEDDHHAGGARPHGGRAAQARRDDRRARRAGVRRARRALRREAAAPRGEGDREGARAAGRRTRVTRSSRCSRSARPTSS